MFDELTPDLRKHLQQALRSLFHAVYGAAPSIRETTYHDKRTDEDWPQVRVRAPANDERGAVRGAITGGMSLRECYLHLIRELHEKLEDESFDFDWDGWVKGDDDV
ncbi:MAG: hypothetical protein EPO40_06085 [Myxococcaceae bacterium]|nr:MAG: hypothetical protein EPO40_06085 [Myxococcaceae bacterium]